MIWVENLQNVMWTFLKRKKKREREREHRVCVRACLAWHRCNPSRGVLAVFQQACQPNSSAVVSLPVCWNSPPKSIDRFEPILDIIIEFSIIHVIVQVWAGGDGGRVRVQWSHTIVSLLAARQHSPSWPSLALNRGDSMPSCVHYMNWLIIVGRTQLHLCTWAHMSSLTSNWQLVSTTKSAAASQSWWLVAHRATMYLGIYHRYMFGNSLKR